MRKTSAVCGPQSTPHTTAQTWHVWPPGFFYCQSDCPYGTVSVLMVLTH